MSRLTIWADDAPASPLKVTEKPDEIASALTDIGVHFERWTAAQTLAPGATPDDVLTAYAVEIARLSQDGGYASADVIRLAKGTPNTAPMRAKFLDEHTHAEDEVRFFVEGSGAFYLRGAGRVYQLVCVQNDLISVPAGIRHWFDMGPEPHFTAIRLFTSPEGWVAQFTGDAIAGSFPLYTS